MNVKKNKDTKNAELLRLIIQKMTYYPGTFKPITYSVWYDFFTGANPDLTIALNGVMGNGGVVDDVIIEKMYNKYISKCTTCSLKIQQILKNEVKELLTDIITITTETKNKTNEVNDKIIEHSSLLKQDMLPIDISAIVDNVIDDTELIKNIIHDLQNKLEDSRKNVNEMYIKLIDARAESLYDPLTGLLNRRGFEDSLNGIEYDEISILIIDIDKFKSINDTHGHLFGDTIIKTIGGILQSNIRKNDYAARWGGDEFVIALPSANVTTAYKIAEAMRHITGSCDIVNSITKEKIDKITLSIGIATANHNIPINELINQADKALYLSKKEGRNKVSIYNKNSTTIM